MLAKSNNKVFIVVCQLPFPVRLPHYDLYLCINIKFAADFTLSRHNLLFSQIMHYWKRPFGVNRPSLTVYIREEKGITFETLKSVFIISCCHIKYLSYFLFQNFRSTFHHFKRRFLLSYFYSSKTTISIDFPSISY